MAVFLGVVLVVFYGLAALGAVLLIFGPQKANEGHITKTR
jgi:hypothetical protein